MTPLQQEAHDWLMARKDLIRDCQVLALITKKACRARQVKWRNHYMTKDDEANLVLLGRFIGCRECPHFSPVRIPKRKQCHRGEVARGLNPFNMQLEIMKNERLHTKHSR